MATSNAKLIERGLMLKIDTVVDATPIAASSPLMNDTAERCPATRQTTNGKQFRFWMKAFTDVDTDSGLIHTVITSAANAHKTTQTHALMHDEKETVFADSAYQIVQRQREMHKQQPDVNWHIALMPGQG